jgi:hypothetical protein
MRQAELIPVQMNRPRNDRWEATFALTGHVVRGFGATADVAEERCRGMIGGAIQRRLTQQLRHEEDSMPLNQADKAEGNSHVRPNQPTVAR